MGLNCGMSMVKYGLFIFNLICAVAGIALIVVGSLPLFKLDDIKDAFPENNPAILPIAVLVLGSIIFTISFFGCCGAIRESQCMVSTYAFFLLVLVVLQVVVAVFAFMYTEEVATGARKAFQTLWDNVGHNPSDRQSLEAINGLQRALHCCGNSGPNDWLTRGGVPTSCCSDGSTCTVANAFEQGCGQLLFDAVNGSGLWIAWVAIVFAGFELVGVIFACCLANSIRNSTRRQYA